MSDLDLDKGLSCKRYTICVFWRSITSLRLFYRKKVCTAGSRRWEVERCPSPILILYFTFLSVYAKIPTMDMYGTISIDEMQEEVEKKLQTD